jgi:hypothetical protein
VVKCNDIGGLQVLVNDSIAVVKVKCSRQKVQKRRDRRGLTFPTPHVTSLGT